MVLNTARLRLRRIVAADLEHLVALHADPQVMRYISGGKPESREALAAHTLPRWIAHHAEPPPVGYWAAFEHMDFLGWFMLRPDADVADALEIGYRLHVKAWGRGFATEGARALVRRAFRDTGTKRVTGQALKGNRASRHVLEKVGLGFERAFIYPESVLPERNEEARRGVRYVLTRRDWERSTAHESG